MSIHEQEKCISLHTKNTTYQMKVDEYGFLHHLYYGPKIENMDLSYAYRTMERSCAANPDDVYPRRDFSLNTFPQEYSGCGVGDFRPSGIVVENADGSYGVDFRYVAHEILDEKYTIPGMPAVYDNGGEAQTLKVVIQDSVTNLVVELYYGVFEELDIITRYARIVNAGKESIQLRKAASMCMDFAYGKWDMIHFPGAHASERKMERTPVRHMVQTVGSKRGESSHQENPFVILCHPDTNEDYGSCYGFMFVYSGNFKVEVEQDQFESTRVVMGIHDEMFSWKLESGESFDTPEVILSYSNRGFTELSHNYHRVIRNNVCRGKYKYENRPVLINNWEATYFDFDNKKLLEIADEAADLGIELLVLDDGWFGERDSDNAGLGDWFVNENKIKGGLKSLIESVNEKGLKFGIWIEPEMVNENSELYRNHPDWAFAMPGRKPGRARNQLVLDMSRKEVRDHIYDLIAKILRENHIEYVKWDMNRSLSDLYSSALPREKQGEVAHRYMLGVYELMERFTSEFPDILFEGCSGGGARFDAGVMYYSPQVWCSDNTDPIQRLSIQYGTSFGYPCSVVGAHVSASPNHQTGRETPFHTRGVVAMSGTFGYELDPEKLTSDEKEQIKEQIKSFKRYQNLISNGKYYRLTKEKEYCYHAWQFASEDGQEALLNLVMTEIRANIPFINVCLKGLDPDAVYCVKESGETFTGEALMYRGYTFPMMTGDYKAVQILFEKQ